MTSAADLAFRALVVSDQTVENLLDNLGEEYAREPYRLPTRVRYEYVQRKQARWRVSGVPITREQHDAAGGRHTRPWLDEIRTKPKGDKPERWDSDADKQHAPDPVERDDDALERQFSRPIGQSRPASPEQAKYVREVARRAQAEHDVKEHKPRERDPSGERTGAMRFTLQRRKRKKQRR